MPFTRNRAVRVPSPTICCCNKRPNIQFVLASKNKDFSSFLGAILCCALSFLRCKHSLIRRLCTWTMAGHFEAISSLLKVLGTNTVLILLLSQRAKQDVKLLLKILVSRSMHAHTVYEVSKYIQTAMWGNKNDQKILLVNRRGDIFELRFLSCQLFILLRSEPFASEQIHKRILCLIQQYFAILHLWVLHKK